MATSVGHGLIGVATYGGLSALPFWNVRLPMTPAMLLAAGVAANLPDLDMVASLVFFQKHTALHGGFTHSIAFAALTSGGVWLVARKSPCALTLTLLTFLLVSSHVLVDFLTGPRVGFVPSRGTPMFWPVSEDLVRAPVTLFKGVVHQDILPGALWTALWELCLLGPMAVLAVLFGLRSAERHSQRRSGN